ncbi:MAG TPA: MerR family transcriptional regulator [Acidimicrobiales bacterium]|nr:MerR family transcriptional regulator [Acidimicrobiales bacterium]
MDLRVEQLAARAEISVDTIRFYQARGLLPPPRRVGRVAWYATPHIDRLERIRSLQSRGLSLATIKRLLNGELDAADEALLTVLSEERADQRLSAAELADRSGIPLALLQAVAREGLLVPRRDANGEHYTEADVAIARDGLALLEEGLPLAELLALARVHHDAMRAVAERAVGLFDTYIRSPLRDRGVDDATAAARLVDSFQRLLPATTNIVSHHFERVLLAAALDHIEHVGADAEVEAVRVEAAKLVARRP